KLHAAPASTVRSGLHDSVGDVVSRTLTVCTQVALFPQASVARQVRVASKVLPQWPVMLVTVLRTVMVTSPQVSVAVGASKDQVLQHSTVLLPTQMMVGVVVSCTVTFWLQSAVLPQASVARQVRVASKVLPQWPVMLVTVLRTVMVTLPQVSVAVGASKDQLLEHSTVLLPTQMMVGLVVSCTVTFWLHSAVLPQASVARQVRVASNVLPQWPVRLVTVLRTVMVTLPQVSVAVGASKDQVLEHSTVLLPTQMMVGLVVSCTVTFWLHSAVLPQASVARQVRVASNVLPQWPVVLVTVLTMMRVTLPQVSLAVGGSKDQVLVHSTVLPDTQAMVGGV